MSIDGRGCCRIGTCGPWGPWEHSPGFSLGRHFYNAFGLKDRGKRLVRYNPTRSCHSITTVFLLEFMPLPDLRSFRPSTLRHDYPG